MITTKKYSIPMVCCFSIIFIFASICHVYAVDLSSEEKEYLRAKGTIVFVSQTRYPPFEFTDAADNQHEGMMLDFVRWMAVEMGFKPVFLDMTFQQAQEAVISGKADILTSLFYSDKRKERFEFTETLFDVPASIFIRAERTDIKDIDDLNGKTIAMQRGDYAKDFMESKKIRFDTLDTNDFAEALDRVITGKADAVIGDEQIVFFHLFSNRLTDYAKKVGEPLYIGRNCMASKKGNAILIRILDKGIHEAKKTGVLDKINTKWLGMKYGPQKSFLERYLWHVAAVAGGILLLSLWVWIWNIRLRILVKKKTEVITRREEALRESEEKYRTLTDNIPDIVYSLDAEGNILTVNMTAVARYGYDAQMMVGKPFLSVIHPDDQEMVVNSFLQAVQDHREYTKGFQFRVLAKDGSVHWAELHSHMRFDDQWRYFQEEGVLRDITNRKQAEKELRESEEKYKNLFENANEAMFVAQDGKLVFLNMMTAIISGYSTEELMSKPFIEFIHQDDRQMVIDRHIGRMRGEDLSQRYDFRIIHKDSGIRWVELNVVFISWNEKPATLNFMSDITGRKLVEEALRESEERHRTILNEMEEGYQEVDLAGNFTFFNEPFLKLFGYSRDEMMGTNFSLYAAEEAIAKKVYHAYNQMYKTGIPIKSYEWDILRKDGARRTLEFYASILRDSNDHPTGFRGIVRDVTDRKQLEERLSRAEKMEALGQLAGGVAHDLNNVLGVLVGYSELLLEKLPADSPLRKYADSILQSGIRGAAIIEDLLTLARRGVSVSEVVDLNRVVSDYLATPEFEKLAAQQPQIKIRTVLEKRLLNIKGSLVHLGKVVMNLVSNAAEAISGSGEVTIKTDNCYLDLPIRGYDDMRQGEYVVLTVSDTGSGISADDLSKIFEPFYTKKVMGKSGTGLGLSVVWGTVKDHNGYIDVQSDEGKGSTFSLYFPVTREDMGKMKEKDSPAAYAGRGESILVVDDVKEQRELAVSMLGRIGYRVETVAGGEEAIEYLKDKKADVVVLDMIMAPGIDGLETYRRMIEINPAQKAVIVSGFSETDRVRKAQEMGAGAFVRKPYLIERLGVAVRKELDRI